MRRTLEAETTQDDPDPNFYFYFPFVELPRPLLCSRLYVLQGGLAQQEWRVSELLHRLLQYLEPKLTQVYKNVRERIGR